MGEMVTPTTMDYLQLAAQKANDKATNARNEVEALKLQVQELRQFCIMIILNTPATGVFSQIGLQIDQRTQDHWWEKLGSYPRVVPAGDVEQ